jgi:hypothetical protein
MAVHRRKSHRASTSRRRYSFLWVAILCLLSGLTLSSPSQAAAPKQVLILGDSLVGSSSNYINFYLAHDGKAQTTVRSVGGTAICDLLPGNGGPWTLDSLLSAKRYDAVVIAYSGNALTRCTGYLTGQALVDKYKADANAAMKTSRQYGVPHVVWVKPPAAAAPDLNYVRAGLGNAYGSLPLSWPNARVVDGGNGISPGGKFYLSLPCEAWEKTAAHGCVKNSIRVGDADGVHFYCSRRGPAYYGVVPPCDTYSSGSNRYGMNLGATRRFIGL